MASISPLHGGLVWKDKQRPTKLNPTDFEFLRPAGAKHEEDKEQAPDVNAHFDPQPSPLPLEERVRLVLSVGEKTYQEDEVLPLLKRKP